MTVDLHTHSLASDGTLPAAIVVELAASLGLHALAICDHDSVEGVSEACSAGKRLGIPVVPGVEFSATEGDRSIHVLGYFIDHTDRTLLRALSSLREARLERARDMVALLAADGFMVDFRDILATVDGGAIGRAHIAAVLVRSGHAETLEGAFSRFVGRTAPYFVSKPPVDIATVVSAIHDTGGLAVIAHPGISGADEYLSKMIASGIDGLEALHAEHTAAQRAHYTSLAVEHGLLITGGSDFHGPDMAGHSLGAGNVPDEIFERLAAAAGDAARSVLP
ncbi:MAG: PHP domain-containing protein [Coriobacteriia bacterium]|nr:PHP domain-containing protein [Coriobacteriia bacterium]